MGGNSFYLSLHLQYHVVSSLDKHLGTVNPNHRGMLIKRAIQLVCGIKHNLRNIFRPPFYFNARSLQCIWKIQVPYFPSMTLRQPHYVNNVNFVSNWTTFLICLILFYFCIFFLLSNSMILDYLAKFIVDGSIFPLRHAFISSLIFFTIVATFKLFCFFY